MTSSCCDACTHPVVASANECDRLLKVDRQRGLHVAVCTKLEAQIR